MNHFELILSGVALGSQAIFCSLVYLRKVQSRLPFFVAYATILIVGDLSAQLVYYRFGFRSSAAYYAFWVVTGGIGLAQGFAIAELCRYTLRAYHGIWALAWRILVVMAAAFFLDAALDAWGQPQRVEIYGLTLERDIALGTIVILLAMLLFHKYYHLRLEPLHKWIALGMIVISAVNVFNNTLLQNTFTHWLSFWFFTKYSSLWSGISSQVAQAKDLWNAIRTSGLIGSIAIWCFALRKPLPVPASAPVLLPKEVYAEFSPAVNLRLRAFNDRLLELLKT
jgi:hypothetical protein